MQVEAIYDNGKLEFVEPIKLRHQRVRLVVTVPDDEVQAPVCSSVSAEVVQRARAMREMLDAARDAALPADDQLPELTARQLQRIEAFELREDR